MIALATLAAWTVAIVVVCALVAAWLYWTGRRWRQLESERFW